MHNFNFYGYNVNYNAEILAITYKEWKIFSISKENVQEV